MKTPEPRIETKAHNLVEMSDAVISEAIKKDFGLDVKIQEKVINGYQSQVYKATLDGKTVFIRINKKPQKFEVEILGYKIFKDIGIPTPDVIAYQAKPANIGQATIILSAAEGVSIGDAGLSEEQDNTVYEEVGKILKTINEVKLEGFGPLEISEGKLKGRFKTYREYCESWGINVNKSIDYLLTSKYITPEEAQKIRNIFEEISLLNIGQGSLLHRDLHRGHIFINKGKITGVIDLEKITAGDSRYDIAVSMAYEEERQQQYFRKGYGDLAEDPMVTKYLLVLTVEKILGSANRGRKDSEIRRLALLKEMLAKVA